jgi:uncharacterized protein (DUF488 family)
MQPLEQNPIWTIGHSTMPIGEFLGLLRLHGIEAVVDVRTAPYSRFAPQFNKLDLHDALRRSNIAYRFEGERLGGRPSDPTCYRSGALPGHAQREEFLKLVDYEAVKQKNWFVAGLDDVIALSARDKVALMCSEENPLDCHRHRLIASALSDREIEVRHIRKDGSLSTAVFSAEPALVQSLLF